jgi:hypothetical protein
MTMHNGFDLGKCKTHTFLIYGPFKPDNTENRIRSYGFEQSN